MSATPPRNAKHRRFVFVACLLATFTTAIEATIVATSMPSIVAQIGGFKYYAWAFSIYLLTQVVTTPIYGKLIDTYGRKPVLVAGLSLFMLGSLACGFATSMTMLIAFRFFQGLGAGAVQPVSLTIIGDIYSIKERASLQGYVSAVWGISSIAGPIVGGVIVQTLGWSWIFWVSIPFGIACIALVGVYLHENVAHTHARIDFPGAGLLFIALSALILVLTLGPDLALDGGAALLALSAAVFWMLVVHIKRAPDPIIDLRLWTRPLIAHSNVAGLLAGVVMIGPVSFLPLFVQGVLGGSAITAGLVLTGMSIGWTFSSIAAGKLFGRLGTRNLSRIGGVMLLAGALTIAFAWRYGVGFATAGTVLIGTAMGFLSTSFLFGIQMSLGWAERGAATASMVLTRLLGNAVGASLFGGVLNYSLQRYLDRHGANGMSLDSVRDLLAGHGAVLQSAAALTTLREGLNASVQLVFWVIAIIAMLGLAASWRVPALDLRKLAADERT